MKQPPPSYKSAVGKKAAVKTKDSSSLSTATKIEVPKSHSPQEGSTGIKVMKFMILSHVFSSCHA